MQCRNSKQTRDHNSGERLRVQLEHLPCGERIENLQITAQHPDMRLAHHLFLQKETPLT